MQKDLVPYERQRLELGVDRCHHASRQQQVKASQASRGFENMKTAIVSGTATRHGIGRGIMHAFLQASPSAKRPCSPLPSSPLRQSKL